MKTLFSRRRSRAGLLTPGAVVAGVLALCIVILAIIRFAAPGAFTAMVSPLWGAGTSATAAVGAGATLLESKESIVASRDALAHENERLMVENRVLVTRAQDLQMLLGTRTEVAPGILAGVLVRPPVSPYDVLIVDQGTDAGIALGATAYGPGGTPLGTVASVARTSARITLYSNPGLETAGWAGDARVPVTLRGTGSGSFTAELPRDVGVTEGQAVYVSGPGALPIGNVARVDRDPSSPEVVLHIHPYANPFSLTWVTISP